MLSSWAAGVVDGSEDITVQNPVDEQFGAGTLMDETMIEFQFESDPKPSPARLGGHPWVPNPEQVRCGEPTLSSYGIG